MFSKFSRIIMLGAVVAVVATTAAAHPALAAKGGKAGSTTARVWTEANGVAVTSVPAGTAITVKCAGFPANTTVYIDYYNHFNWVGTVTDSAGNCSLYWGPLTQAGNYTFFADIPGRHNDTIVTAPTLTVY